MTGLCGNFRRRVALTCAVWLCAVGPAEAGRLTFTEENDAYIAGTDRHYTQGLRVSYLSRPIGGSFWNKPFDWMSDAFGLFPTPSDPAVKSQRRIEWTVLGHSIFTPTDIHRTNPDPTDRPYAAWLYTGAAFLQENKTARRDELENFEVLVGVIGPSALGREVQNNYHAFIRVRPALGWAHQLADEPGIMATYERKWRYPVKRGKFGVDLIPTAGATFGNVLTYAQAGATFRFGQNLDADYGPAQVRPSISGTAWFDEAKAHGKVGWSLFVGAQGRAVARNLFLEGNSFAASRSVPKRVFVIDVAVGASLWISHAVKVDVTLIERSPEFKGQRGWDRFGMVSASVAFW